MPREPIVGDLSASLPQANPANDINIA